MKSVLLAIALCPLLVWADPATNAVYANYFAGTTPPTRYLRYIHAIAGAERIAHPTRPGHQALRLTVRYEPTAMFADLFWDLSPIACNRIRFRVWNPNPTNPPIYLAVRMGDSDEHGYFLHYFKHPTPGLQRPASAADPLPTSLAAAGDRGWITYEARLPADILNMLPKGEQPPTVAELRTRAFRHLTMSFFVHNNFTAWGQPLTLIVEGLELYDDPR